MDEIDIKDDMIELLQEHLDNFVEMKKRLLVEIENAKIAFPVAGWRGSINSERLYFLQVLENILGEDQD